LAFFDEIFSPYIGDIEVSQIFSASKDTYWTKSRSNCAFLYVDELHKTDLSGTLGFLIIQDRELIRAFCLFPAAIISISTQ
jgi:hypothetical protein